MTWGRSLPITPEITLGPVYTFVRTQSESDLPVVVSDPHNFMMLAHYAPHDLSSRFVYLTDPARSLRHLGHNTMDRGILDLRPWFRLNIQDAEGYEREHARFLLYVNARYLGGSFPLSGGQVTPDHNWLLSDLVATGWQLELKARQDNQLLFMVTRK